jgi:DNA invertase Pin-like site-specific DNA recombinase
MQSTQRPIAVGYRRVSTEDQGKSGLGLADQDEMIRRFCQARGLTLDSTYTEVESGKRDDRPELRKALARSRRVKGILVVSTLSRLGRKVAFVANMMNAGTPFACADAPDDEPFILHVKASFAEEEARKIGQRTKAALAQAKAKGVKLGNPENLTDAARAKGRARAAEVIRERAAEANAAIADQVVAYRATGMPLRQIATEVGVSLGTVQRLLDRAIAQGAIRPGTTSARHVIGAGDLDDAIARGLRHT